MRIRHLALAVLGLAALAVAVEAATGNPGAAPPVLDDGTINVTAVQDGRGAWVPYTLTVRNLGDRDFTGQLLMLKQAAPAVLPPVRVRVKGVGSFATPLRAGGQAQPPDAAYQFPVALSPRHKQTYNFFAPDDFLGVVVQDGRGRRVAEGQVDDRRSVAVGTLTDSANLAAELEAIRIGELTMRVTKWDDSTPFPAQTVYLSGFSAIVIDRFDSGRMSKSQLAALTDFVALGGELVLAGGADLARTLHALPTQLVPFSAGGSTASRPLTPVADLSGAATSLVAPVATGTLAAGATVVLDASDGNPLEVESRYGSGRIVELLFDPDAPAAAGTVGGFATLALSQAVARGLESIPGSDPAGRTLLDAGDLPPVLFPRPSDAPFPPLWLVGGLLLVYLAVVAPANYFLVRRSGRPALFWATAPALAVVFAGISYAIGLGLQAGIRDQEFQFFRLGPDGIVSRVDIHGLVFPTRGDHLLTFGGDALVAPYTITFPDLIASCAGCSFLGGAGGTDVEEHVLQGRSPAIAERGLVYGSVRVVGSASSGTGGLNLAAHLTSVDDRLTGTIVNTGTVPISGLILYTYYAGGYRAALVAAGLTPGSTARVEVVPQPIGDSAPPLPPGTRLTANQEVSLVADETGRRTLTHPGQVAIVGFVRPVDSRLAVDGAEPPGQVVAAFGMPVEVESAQVRLGEVAVPRLAAFSPETASGLFLDTYDIALPAASGPLVLRYDKRLYTDVQVYDWQARAWRAGPFSPDPASSIVMLAELDPAEVHQGLVRVRVHEIALTWGSEITVRFPGESP